MEHLTHKILEPFIFEDSEVLFLGTFPSIKSREYGFYYSHKRNRFFLVLSKIFSTECPTSINDKKEFLRKHHIALYDVIEECDINNSEDSSIRNVVPSKIDELLKKYPNIKCIGLTGSKASSVFKKYFSYLEDVVDVYYLPSTSPANAKMSVEELTKEYSRVF